MAKKKIENSYYQICPERIPKGLISWIRQEVLPKDNTIIYKRGNRRGKCYICGSEIKAIDCFEYDNQTKFVQGFMSTCPVCKTRCRNVLEDGAQWKSDNVANVATIQRGKDGSLWIREWHILRTDKPEISRNNLLEIARYCLAFVNGKWKAAKWVKECKDNWFGSHNVYYLDSWYRNEKIVSVYDGLDHFMIPDNWGEIVKDTPLEYCDIEELQSSNSNKKLQGNPIRWILDFCRYPVVEKLYKAGYIYIVSEIEGYGNCKNVINRQAKTIPSALHLPLWALKLKKPQEWTVMELEKLQPTYKLYEEGKITKEEIPVILNYRVGVKHYDLAVGHASVERIHDYIDHMNENHSYSSWQPVGDYNDYLRMCNMLGMDLNNKRILFPKNIEKTHNELVERLKAKENKELSLKITERAMKLSKYNFDNGVFLIRPAENWAELNTEGKTLHHCVVTYADRVASGSTSIFFVRKTDASDIPFYTLELKDKRIIQCRTLNNKSYESDSLVKSFVDLWYQLIIQKKKKSA